MARDVIIEFRAELDRLKADLRRTQGELRDTGAQAKKADKSIDNINKSGDKVLNTFKNMAVAAGAAFGIQEVLRLGKEMIDLAGKAQGVERAFKRIGSTDLLAGMRKATRGTVTDLQLMQEAVKASNFNIPLTELATLFEFASRRAQETGESVDYLVQSIILGIGRKSPLILDNLGISAIELRKRLGAVSTEAASIGDVTEVVGAIARRELDEMGESALTTADRVAQLNTKWDNTKVIIGKQLTPVVDDFLTGFNLFLESGSTHLAILGSLTNRHMRLAEAEKMTADEMAAAIQVMMPFADSIDDQISLLKTYAENLINANTALSEALLPGINATIKALERQKEAQEGNNNITPNTIASLQAQKKEYEELLQNTQLGTEAFYFYRSEVQRLDAQIKKWTESAGDAKDILEELEQIAAGQARAAAAGEAYMEAMITAMQETMSEGVDALIAADDESLTADLLSKVGPTPEEREAAKQLWLDYGASERQFTEERVRQVQLRADALREEGALTKEQYDDILTQSNLALDKFRQQQNMAAIGALQAISSSVNTVGDAIASTIGNQAKAAQFQKDFALFTIPLNLAVAIARTIAEAAAVPFPANLGIIAGGIAAVVSNMAQANALISQSSVPEVPSFGRGGRVGGRKHSEGGTLIEAEYGEYVVNAKSASKHKDAIEAINKGSYEQYVVRHYIEPLQRQIERGRGRFADNIAASLADQLAGQSGYLRKMSKGIKVSNIDQLARAMQQPNVNRFKA